MCYGIGGQDCGCKSADNGDINHLSKDVDRRIRETPDEYAIGPRFLRLYPQPDDFIVSTLFGKCRGCLEHRASGAGPGREGAQTNVCPIAHFGGRRTDVELKELETGKAVLQAKAPDIKESGVHCAKNVDLLVVARIPDGETVSVIKELSFKSFEP